VARTIIDEAIVMLRLDDSQFDKAVAEAIAARQTLTNESEKHEKKESSSIGALTRRWLTFAAALGLVTKAFGKFQSIADNLRDLSNESRRLGMSSAGLRTWQNAIEMLGGKAEDATSEVDKFTQSLNNLIFKGEVGDNLQWLNRLGISVHRGMTYDDTARQVFTGLQEGLASGTIKSRQEAGFIARQAGFGSVGEFITQRKGDTLSDFDAFIGASATRVASEADIALGRDYAESRIERRQERYGPLAETFMRGEETLNASMDALNDGFIKMLNWLNSPAAPWNGGSLRGWIFGESATTPVTQATPSVSQSAAPSLMNFGSTDAWAMATPTPLAIPSGGGNVSVGQIVVQPPAGAERPVDYGRAVQGAVRKSITAQSDGSAR
jgi:hypothetical protein